MKVLVTGSDGFLGSSLVRKLKNHKVKGFDIRSGQDITDLKQVKRAVKGKDFVFHLAGLLGTHELVEDSIIAAKVNIIGTLNVLEACKQYKAKLIFASKPNVWVNTYSITKEAAEKFIEMYREEFGVEAVILKWFNVYGPGQRLFEEVGYRKAIPTWIVNGLKGKPIEIYGSGKQTMDLIHVDDATEAAVAVMRKFKDGKVYEAGHDEIEANTIAEIIQEKTGGRIVHLPMRQGELPATKLKADMFSLVRDTGWKPKINLKDGLEQTIKWYEEKYGKAGGFSRR